MTGPPYSHAVLTLRVTVSRLLLAAGAEEADSWGADVFRRLMSYARAVALDLEADLYRGAAGGQALDRLERLGTELNLHDWADLWPAGTTVVQEAQAAVLAFREVVRARAEADVNSPGHG
jgi:hypothetical protein